MLNATIYISQIYVCFYLVIIRHGQFNFLKNNYARQNANSRPNAQAFMTPRIM